MRLLIVFVFLLVFISSPSNGQKVYGYVFCKTLDEKLKEPAEINYLKVKDLFQLIATTLNYEYVDRSLRDDKFTQAKVLNAIKGDTFKDNDIVFFYINTHGQNNKWTSESLFPTIDIPQSLTSSEELFMTIVNKNPKICIGLIEACNGYETKDDKSILQEAFLEKNVDANNVVQPESVIKNNMKTLLTPENKYIVCASEKGMIAYALSNGSIFTNKFILAFKEAINYNDASRANWKWILETSKKYTSNRTQAFEYKHSPIWQRYVSGKLISQGILDTNSIVRNTSLNVIVTRRKLFGLFWSKYRNVEVSINSTKAVDSVTYFFHRTMPDSIVTVRPNIGTLDKLCRYSFSVWGEFPIKAIVHFSDLEKEETFGEIIFPDSSEKTKKL